jgi:hypothetical protein
MRVASVRMSVFFRLHTRPPVCPSLHASISPCVFPSFLLLALVGPRVRPSICLSVCLSAGLSLACVSVRRSASVCHFYCAKRPFFATPEVSRVAYALLLFLSTCVIVRFIFRRPCDSSTPGACKPREPVVPRFLYS